MNEKEKFLASISQMSKATLVSLLAEKAALNESILTELGDTADANKITSLTGTPEQKMTAFKSLNDEITAIEERLDAIAEIENLRKNNSSRTSQIKRNGNFSTEKQPEQKEIQIPARARTQHSKVFKDDKDAYGAGMWLISTISKEGIHPKAQRDRAKLWVDEHIDMKALSENTNEDGGALVPYEFYPTLIEIKDQYGVISRNMQKIPMNREVAKIPRINAHNTAYWDTESGTPTESAPTFNNVNLVAKKLTSWLALPMELIEDAAIALGDWVMQDMAWKFAQAEDNAAFIGDGSGTYGNITGFANSLTNLSGTIANIAGLQVASGNAYSEITIDDLMGFVGLLHTQAVPRGVIYCSNRVYWNVFARLAVKQGGVTMAETVNGVTRYMFQGIPVEMTQVMPSIEGNSQICALYGDVNLAAKMGDRRSFSISTSDQVYFLKDQLVIKAHERLDFVVHDVGNASATAGSRVAGPMVGLITAAS